MPFTASAQWRGKAVPLRQLLEGDGRSGFGNRCLWHGVVLRSRLPVRGCGLPCFAVWHNKKHDRRPLTPMVRVRIDVEGTVSDVAAERNRYVVAL